MTKFFLKFVNKLARRRKWKLDVKNLVTVLQNRCIIRSNEWEMIMYYFFDVNVAGINYWVCCCVQFHEIFVIKVNSYFSERVRWGVRNRGIKIKSFHIRFNLYFYKNTLACIFTQILPIFAYLSFCLLQISVRTYLNVTLFLGNSKF